MDRMAKGLLWTEWPKGLLWTEWQKAYCGQNGKRLIVDRMANSMDTNQAGHTCTIIPCTLLLLF